MQTNSVAINDLLLPVVMVAHIVWISQPLTSLVGQQVVRKTGKTGRVFVLLRSLLLFVFNFKKRTYLLIIQLEYEMIRSKTLAYEPHSLYSSGKEFAYDHMSRSQVVPFVKQNWHKAEHRSRRPKKVSEKHPPPVCIAVCCGHQRFRKRHLPRPD